MVWISLCLTLLGGTAYSQDEASHKAQILAILAEAESASEESARALSRRITFQGTEALPSVLEILEQGYGGGLDPQADAGRLTTLQMEILHDSLAMADRGAVISLLEERIAQHASPKMALKILAEVGRGEDIRLALEVHDPASTEELEETVARILKRDAAAYATLKNHVREQSPDNASTLVRAAGATASYAGLQMLLELLDTDPGLDRVLVTHIGRIGQAAPWHVNDQARGSVRGYLNSSDEQTLRGALYAIGGLGDSESVETAIGLLESESQSVREAAHWALKAITGLGFSASHDRWVSWHATESRWYEEQSRRLFSQLSTSSPRGIADALEQLSMRRYRREAIAEQVVVLLNHADPFVRRAACHALRNLHTASAAPALLASMADTDQSVALEAWNALKAITGKHAAFDVETWSRELQL